MPHLIICAYVTLTHSTKKTAKKIILNPTIFFKISCEWQTGISLVYTFKHEIIKWKYISSLCKTTKKYN